MRLRILGSAAGGGFPQWNCACPNCAAVRACSPSVRARTQDSIAVTSDDKTWWLINASPDIHRQIGAYLDMQPTAGRDTPIKGVVLLNGDLDHTLGLFSLRENTPLIVATTDSIMRGLETNTMLRTLQRFDGQLYHLQLEFGEPVNLPGTSLFVAGFPTPGKVPKHLEGIREPSREDNIGIRIYDRDTRAMVMIATSVGSLDGMRDDAMESDLLFFDGTFWSEDELITLGLGKARAADMAHVPISGENGSLARLASIEARKRIYTHINNTNPILDERSPERRAVEDAGWEVAVDGREIVL